MMKESVNINIYIPKILRDRTKIVGEKLCLSTTAIIRTALEKEIVLLEERIVKEEAERTRLKTLRKGANGRTHFSARTISDRMQSRDNATNDPPELTSSDRLQEIYRKYAEQVLLAGDDREAIKRVLADALKAVQRECPLTYPDDATVVREIEREVKRQRDSGPTEARNLDSIVNTPDEEE